MSRLSFLNGGRNFQVILEKINFMISNTFY